MHLMAMRGNGNDWQIASSRDRQITGACGKGGFGLACAGSAMTGELSHSRWPGMVKATAGRSPAHTVRATLGKSLVHAASVSMMASARTGKLPVRGEGVGGGTGNHVVRASANNGGSGEAVGGE